MSVTILEALQNAECNLNNVTWLGVGVIPRAHEQLHNAINLLEKGYSIIEKIDPLLEMYGTVEKVPERNWY